MDERLTRIRDLIATIEASEAELASLMGGAPYQRRKIKCSTCGEEGHTARTCPSKEAPNASPPA